MDMKSSLLLPIMMIAFFPVISFAQIPNFKMTDKDIAKTCNDAIDTATKKIADITANKNDPTFENTVVALENALSEFDMKVQIPVFMNSVASDALTRQAGSDCEVKSKKFVIDVFVRDTLFTRFQAVKNSPKGKALTGEDKKLMDDFYTVFLQNGLGIASSEKRKQIPDLAKQISQLETDFNNNIRDDKRFIQVDKSELVGLPEDWITGLTKAKNGKYIVTTEYPDYFPLMKNAKSENARKRLYEQFSIRGGKKNVEILEKALKLRNDLAITMGFNNYADKVFALDGRMVTSTGQIRKFINELTTSLSPYLDRDLSDMRRLKCRETKCSDWDKVTINPWDTLYYINQMERAKGNVDQEKIKEYFPLQTVVQGMFQIYQTLLSVDFEKINNPNVWDASVETYQVRDRASKDVLGYFLLDLFPRDGKYGHAAVWGLIKPKYLGTNQYQKTVAAMVCNFPKPTADSPSLMHHNEVETFFHEFGHVMDSIVSHTKYYSHGGTSIYNDRGTGTPRDFVEAPSQMLENWVWNPESLAMLSGHYKTGEKLPKDMLDKLLAIKNVANGYINMRQLFMATMDLDYHTNPPVSSTVSWNEKMKQMLKIEPLDTVYPQASFGHIMSGYDVGYYGYMWSLVYAEDMFSVFEKEGVLNPRTGMSYRKKILEPSGSQLVANSIKNFLGRDPNQEAFLKSLGITSTQASSAPANVTKDAEMPKAAEKPAKK